MGYHCQETSGKSLVVRMNYFYGYSVHRHIDQGSTVLAVCQQTHFCCNTCLNYSMLMHATEVHKLLAVIIASMLHFREISVGKKENTCSYVIPFIR